jgi:eukaryotic-like serine/threonine-protein kinase
MNPPQEHDPGIASLDPMPGRVIAGNFRIDKLIGAGAMGNVYKAEQLSLAKPVAVKLLHQHLASDEKLVARFKREAKSASLLNHPNSIQIIDSGEDRDGTLFIAMELLTGRDLAQVIRDDFPLPLRRVGRIMTQVLSALDEAHAHGVIHRDLKPSNIMLIQRRGEQDFVKVCDFGIAKATLAGGEDDRAAMLTIQGMVCGTPEYMSPEQARAEPLDGRADLYSAAVILFQMMTGDIPFRAESPMGIISRHLSEPPVPPSRRRPDLDIPRAVDDIVMRGMDKNRELRFPTAIAFRDAIDVMLNTTIGPLTPLPPSVRAAMPTARDIAGPLTPAGTATVPARSPADRFGTTADMTGRPSRRQRFVVIAGVVLVLGASAVGATVTLRARKAQMAAKAASPPASDVYRVPPRPVAPTPPPAATATEATVTAPAVVPEATAPAPEHKRPRGTWRAARPGAQAATPVAASAAPMAAAAPAPASPAPAAEQAAPAPPRGPREVLAEADKLLAQGEVAEACARGEEAKRMAGKAPAVLKFLGKCYMRAGRTREANDNYKQYLEVAPDAPDAPFVKSMIK